MEFFSDLIQYGYLSNALAACVLSGITCGVVGTYVVCRRMVFLAGGITHASFGGLGIAFYAGANPIAGAMVFAVLSALGIEWAGSRGRIREDSAIGIIWSVGMAVGALFMSLRPGYTSGDLSAYLFGSIVTVTHGDVVALAILTAAIMAGALLWLRPVMYMAFDRDFARSRGIPTRVISYAMAALVAVTIVLSIRIMGIVLLISLLTMPVAIVNALSKSYRTIALCAPLVAVAGNVAGLVASYNFEVPPGAAIIFTLTLTLIMAAPGGHNIYPHPYAYYSKTITFASEKSRSRRMKTIHKLVLKAYLGPMVLTFFIVMFVLMMNIVWRYIDELVGKGLSAGIIIELMTYFMANMIPLGLPLAMLLAAIMTMGNLGENYELLAMKSAGMSLVRITKPLIILVSVIAVGSFFIGNNLVPYANKKVYSIIYDIRQQKQSLEFQDGLFFNGIDNMSIRVSRQEPETHLLRDVLIYDNRIADGNMNTIVADSGYIRLSDDKRFLLVTLFNGEMYEQTRNSQWFTQSRLRHHIFDKQDQTIPMEGFAMQRSDANQFSNSQTKNINELQQDIDSLEILVNNATTRSYEPLLKEQIFSRDNSVLPQPDSLRKDKSGFGSLEAMDSLSALKLRDKARIWNQARTLAKSSRNMFSFDESAAKEALNQLYRSKVEWHKKISLPVSIMIFFLIGAPLGAIIRKGGLGLPVVVSIIFFVIYYIISLSGEKLAKEGSWEAVYGIWLSTFILTPIAVYLTYKATNDSALLDTDWYAGRLKALNERMRPAINKLKNAIKLKRNGKKHDSE